MPTRVRSFCKINLGLRVGPTRADGFHGLATMYQTLGLHDLVTVEARAAAETRITLTANHAGVPRSETGDAERNTAHKMVAGALRRLGVHAEVHVEIDKRLPVQGGLGAGSANAAAALLGVERELRQALPGPERLELAAEVGSDVPLFLLGGSVLGLGRGEQVFPLPDVPVTHCVVAAPKVGVSTGAAFRELDSRMAAEAERAGSPLGLKPLSLENGLNVQAEARTLQSLHFGSQSQGTAAALTSAPVVGKLDQLSRALAACYMQSGSKRAQEGDLQGPDSGITSRTGDLAENPLLALVRTGIENDFEEAVFAQHPSLRSTKRDLMGDVPGSLATGSGKAVYAALSGSGSALFGLYSSLHDAQAAQQRVQRNGTAALLTETLPRAEYWKRMFA